MCIYFIFLISITQFSVVLTNENQTDFNGTTSACDDGTTEENEENGGKKLSRVIIILIIILAGIPAFICACILSNVACSTLKQRSQVKAEQSKERSVQAGKSSSKIGMGFRGKTTSSGWTTNSSNDDIELSSRDSLDDYTMTSPEIPERSFEDEIGEQYWQETSVDEKKKGTKKKKKGKGKKKKSSKK